MRLHLEFRLSLFTAITGIEMIAAAVAVTVCIMVTLCFDCDGINKRRDINVYYG